MDQGSAFFGASSHGDTLAFLVQVGLLLAFARLFGAAARRFGQPAVVGELLAGIVVGPSVLGALAPAVGGLLVPATVVQGHLLEAVALLGAMLLLLVTGLETDLRLLRRTLRTALTLSWCGIALTFTMAATLGWLLPDSLLVDPDRRVVFVLFLASALSITAIPVLARILLDLGLLRHNLGQTLLAAGMSDDLIGWTLLGTVLGLSAQEGTFWPAAVASLLRVGVFLAVMVTVGGWLARRLIATLASSGAGPGGFVSLAVVAMLVGGAVSHALHLEPVLGAFAVGILLGQARRLPVATVRRLEELTLWVFAPVFFALAGTRVDVAALTTPLAWGTVVAVVGVASAGKLGGAWLGSRLLRMDGWTGLALGSGLNARGALEIIVATIGLQAGILGDVMYSAIVIMAIVTSVAAPLALRALLPRLPRTREESDRLRAEARERESSLSDVRRVLVPLRYRPATARRERDLHALLLARFPARMDLTLLTVVDAGQREEGLRFLGDEARLLDAAGASRKVIQSADAAGPILKEAARGYDLLVLGAAEPGTGTDVLFNPIVDYLVRMAPCPTLVVRPGPASESRIERILVPSNGTEAARRAAEMAFTIAARSTILVTILHVMTQETHPYEVGVRPHALERRRLGAAEAIVGRLRDIGTALGARVESLVVSGPDVSSVILQRAVDHDLVILGTAVRPGTEHLFLGPRVERILRDAPCAVVVLNG